jgi:3,4-dihydroxyphenylacetate 2,3-dioxygenase
MYLSELPGPRQGTRQDAIDGHVEIGRRCRELGVDTIVVFDTHWLVNANYHVNCAPHFKGVYTSNELPHFISNMAYELPRQPGAGPAAGPRGNEHGVETLAHDATTLAPEYGTLVPMRYMNADQHFKVVSVSALCTAHYLNDSARLGWAMRRRWKSTTTAPWPSSPAARCRTASRRTAWRRSSPSRSGAPSWSSWTTEVVRCGSRRLGDLLRDAARVRGQGPRRRLHARHRHAAGRAGLERLRRPAEVVTPYFGASGTGQINAVFPVTPQSDASIPPARASPPTGYTAVATRL